MQPERLRRDDFNCEKISYKSVVKGRGCDRWRKRSWGLWWGDACRIRWTRRRVNRVWLNNF